MLDDDDAFSASPSAMLRSFMKQSAFGGDLGDMFGQVHEREMTLARPGAGGRGVCPRPAKGQPADYNGAVGRFDVRASLAPSSGTMFAPMTLKIEVTGQGNLDRVSTPGLPSSASWKTYPPSAKLTPEGTKIFEQAVVPQASGRPRAPLPVVQLFRSRPKPVRDSVDRADHGGDRGRPAGTACADCESGHGFRPQALQSPQRGCGPTRSTKADSSRRCCHRTGVRGSGRWWPLPGLGWRSCLLDHVRGASPARMPPTRSSRNRRAASHGDEACRCRRRCDPLPRGRRGRVARAPRARCGSSPPTRSPPPRPRPGWARTTSPSSPRCARPSAFATVARQRIRPRSRRFKKPSSAGSTNWRPA